MLLDVTLKVVQKIIPLDYIYVLIPTIFSEVKTCLHWKQWLALSYCLI